MEGLFFKIYLVPGSPKSIVKLHESKDLLEQFAIQCLQSFLAQSRCSVNIY